MLPVLARHLSTQQIDLFIQRLYVNKLMTNDEFMVNSGETDYVAFFDAVQRLSFLIAKYTHFNT